jgi:CheY-like chemotaxis protein
VLVVDDELALRTLVGDVLRDEGFEVDTAEDGRSALALLVLPPKPALVLTDHRMPGMDGVALVDALRAMPGFEDVPVAMFSGSGTHGRDVALIEKPITLQALVAAIEALLGK